MFSLCACTDDDIDTWYVLWSVVTLVPGHFGPGHFGHWLVFRILAGGCNVVIRVSRVRVRFGVKVRVRD